VTVQGRFLRWIDGLDEREEAMLVRALGRDESRAVDGDWKSWAHDGQLWPEGAWRTWVIKAGRGFGKTLAGAHWVTAAVAGDSLSGCPRPGAGGGQPHRLSPEPLSIALVGATLAEARKVMVEGRSGLLHVAADWITDWSPSLRRLRFRTGAEATLFSGHSPEILRGPEHHIAWCDELAKWEEAQASWDMLQLGLRLGDRPRALVTTTPRPGPVLKAIMEDPDTIVTGGPTSRNPHVSAAWRGAVYARYAGTRLGRQELEAELLPDAPGALWTVELLTSCRAQASDWGPIASQRVEPASDGQPATRSGDRTDVTDSLRDVLTPPTFTRIVVAVDPPTGDGTCGIIACAKDEAGNAHILADHSVTARTPEGWSRAAADAARMWGQLHTIVPGSSVPVALVAESNQGGQMVKSVLRTADPDLHVKLVAARHGKSERASPVAMLFEAGKVTLHGRFPQLEAELCGMIAGGGYEGPGNSPDRADAMVWGLTELMLEKERPTPRITRL
jgi:phage terminase large subunit-like protein